MAWSGSRSSSRVAKKYLLTSLLKSVSRAFYLSVRVLPHGMREPVAIAYLIARAADTIADTTSAPVDTRIERLNGFRRLIQGEEDYRAASGLSAELTDLQPTEGERALLGVLLQVFELLDQLDDEDAKSVRTVTMTLTDGMLADLRTFRSEDTGCVTALDSVDELDEYCYLIAGCVGEFWTDLSIAHTPSLAHWDVERMRGLGVRFGLALQLTNILRDLPKDLLSGRCYLPQSEIERVGLRAKDLRSPRMRPEAKFLLDWGIARALDHFRAAEEYVAAIPRRNLRLRLAALWPVLIGLETLARLAQSDDWLNPETRIRIPRRAVYGIIALSILSGRSNALTKLWIRRISRRVERSLQSLRPD